jgi:exodeoxyribonuclease VII small subunit
MSGAFQLDYAAFQRAVMSKKPSASDAASPADASVQFEGSLKELEDIVTRMERGDLPLEESLALFERGMTLTRECRSRLDAAELRVRNLLETAGAASTPSTNDSDR